MIRDEKTFARRSICVGHFMSDEIRWPVTVRCFLHNYYVWESIFFTGHCIVKPIEIITLRHHHQIRTQSFQLTSEQHRRDSIYQHSLQSSDKWHRYGGHGKKRIQIASGAAER